MPDKLTVYPLRYTGDGVLPDERGRTLRPGQVGLFTQLSAERLGKRQLAHPARWVGELEIGRLEVRLWPDELLDEHDPMPESASPNPGSAMADEGMAPLVVQEPAKEGPAAPHPQRLVYDAVVAMDQKGKAVNRKHLQEVTGLGEDDLDDALKALTGSGDLKFAGGWYRLGKA